MKLPNRERAVIAEEKLTQYLLNAGHRRGAAKARLLHQFGYNQAGWQTLADAIREYHLEAEVSETRETPYGTRYEISAPILTPSGRHLRLRTIWQIDRGSVLPRLITLFPD